MNGWGGSVLRKFAVWPTPKKNGLALLYLTLGSRTKRSGVIQGWLSRLPWSQRLSISLESEDQGRCSSTSRGHLRHYCIVGRQLAICAFPPDHQAPCAVDTAEIRGTWDQATLGIQTTDPMLFPGKRERCIQGLVQRTQRSLEARDLTSSSSFTTNEWSQTSSLPLGFIFGLLYLPYRDNLGMKQQIIKALEKKLKCNIHVCFPHNSDTWSLNDYISARSSLGWIFLYPYKENCQTESLLTPDTFPHPLLCARRTGALPRVGFSGPSLVLSLIPYLVSVPGPAGCWQTDRPCRWAGPDVEGAESPTRPV